MTFSNIQYGISLFKQGDVQKHIDEDSVKTDAWSQVIAWMLI